MENLPILNQEIENSREKLPVKDMEIASVALALRYDDSFPAGKFSSNEDLIAYKEKPDGTLNVMPNIESSIQQLQTRGFENAGSSYAVPGTGSETNRRGREELRDVDRTIAYNLASMDAGLKELDYNSINPDQSEALRSIGFKGTNVHNLGLLTDGEASYRVSSGSSVDNIEERASQIGTFAETTIQLDDQGYEIAGIAFTDQSGNQVIAPKSETLDNLLMDLGYSKVQQVEFNTKVFDDIQESRVNGDPSSAIKQNLFKQFTSGGAVRAAFDRARS